MNPIPPVVLALSGHDPGGGAGIQADIEAIRDQGCHAATAVTCLTVQNSCGVRAVHPVAPSLFLDQARAVLDELQPAVIKIGLVPDAAIAEAVVRLLEAAPSVPVVLDPVLRAGAGMALAAVEPLRALLPRCRLITPNRAEARTLAEAREIDTAARRLLSLGCDAVLVTGADEAAETVVNRLYRADGERCWRWPKLPGSYHGSGCTLAAAIAGRLALGESTVEAVAQAQRYTFQALAQAAPLGRCQLLPRRHARQK